MLTTTCKLRRRTPSPSSGSVCVTDCALSCFSLMIHHRRLPLSSLQCIAPLLNLRSCCLGIGRVSSVRLSGPPVCVLARTNPYPRRNTSRLSYSLVRYRRSSSFDSANVRLGSCSGLTIARSPDDVKEFVSHVRHHRKLLLNSNESVMKRITQKNA